jgi:uncharacterized membrane protein YjgN (DUF898 family)
MHILIPISITLMFFISIFIWAIVGQLWGKFRGFFHNNYSFFDASFIMAYFIEQLLLTLLISTTIFNPPFLAGIFAIIVITTASFQKLMGESRLKEISETSIEQNIIIDDVTKINDMIVAENEDLKITINNLRKFIENLQQKR